MNIILFDAQTLVAAGLKQLIAQIPKMQVLDSFSDMATGLSYLQQNPNVDLVITDLTLKDASGIDLLREIKENYPNIKVMFLTMEDELEKVAFCMQGGASAFLSKKTDITEMSFAIDRILMGRKYICSLITTKAFETKGAIRQSEADVAIFSERELSVLAYVGNGLTNHEIADKMFLSRRTVEGHRQNLLRKTNAQNTATLIKFAVSNGLIE
ncbi:MAG: response regulator transcription factor [Flavobacteriales bacterium]|nr:MAG: response regulator transcription factor [Flavobacteriales bacterium]